MLYPLAVSGCFFSFAAANIFSSLLWCSRRISYLAITRRWFSYLAEADIHPHGMQVAFEIRVR